jgi:D-methionine transport system substrate-binding protein
MFAVGMGLFSERYTSIEDLPENASIAIMNDSMNMDRGLRILADADLLSIDPSKKTVSLIDIEKNSKNFKFVEMDQTQTVRSLQDMDAAMAFFSHMKNADKDFNNYLIRDQRPDQYPQGVIVKAENAKAKWAHDLVEAFHSKKIRDFAYKHYGGLYEYFD